METSLSCLKTNFITRFFKDDLLTFKLFIGMIKFRDCQKNPECLTVQLLFKIAIEQIL